MTRSSNHGRRLIATVGIALLVVACSIPRDERVTPYNQGELPPDIANTTTSTSTTTTTTTTVPEVSVPAGETTTTVVESTTTIAITVTAPVDIYYTVGFSDVLQRLRQNLPVDRTIQTVIAQLESPVQEVRAGNYRSSVLPGLIASVAPVNGTATVTLDQDVLDRMSNPNQRRAIAQIVLTLTSFVTNDEGAIGQVRFEVDGEQIEVFVPALGASSLSGEAVSFSDFRSLVVSAPPSATTVPTDDPPASAAPPTSPPPGT
ncbi:MAG: GerMN domain-containing protein [Ilumatobacteraceae bacterium]